MDLAPVDRAMVAAIMVHQLREFDLEIESQIHALYQKMDTYTGGIHYDRIIQMLLPDEACENLYQALYPELSWGSR